MMAHERRQIGYALRDFYSGDYDAGIAALVRMAGDYAPDPKAYRGSTVAIEPQIRRDFLAGITHSVGRPDSVPGLPQPKPRKRLVDKQAIREYVRTHPDCEVGGCNNIPCPEPHHLISRKMRGDDVPQNLLRLCRRMHMEWHTWGGRRWLVRYGHLLTDDAKSKVMAALRMDT